MSRGVGPVFAGALRQHNLVQAMGRASRTFRLRLSPAGVDLLIDCHCLVIRSTRRLLAGGTTLHVAIDYLDRLPARHVLAQLDQLPRAGLSGSQNVYFYAPEAMWEAANRIARRVNEIAPERPSPALGHIYIAALQQLALVDREALKTACAQLPSSNAK